MRRMLYGADPREEKQQSCEEIEDKSVLVAEPPRARENPACLVSYQF